MNIKKIIGLIRFIKLLSPSPIEFITTASEFLYSCDIVIIIDRKKDNDNIIGVSLSMLKPTNGISSLIGIPKDILS